MVGYPAGHDAKGREPVYEGIRHGLRVLCFRRNQTNVSAEVVLQYQHVLLVVTCLHHVSKGKVEKLVGLCCVQSVTQRPWNNCSLLRADAVYGRMYELINVLLHVDPNEMHLYHRSRCRGAAMSHHYSVR